MSHPKSRCYVLLARLASLHSNAVTGCRVYDSFPVSPTSYRNTIFNQSAHVFSLGSFLKVFIDTNMNMTVKLMFSTKRVTHADIMRFLLIITKRISAYIPEY